MYILVRIIEIKSLCPFDTLLKTIIIFESDSINLNEKNEN